MMRFFSFWLFGLGLKEAGGICFFLFFLFFTFSRFRDYRLGSVCVCVCLMKWNIFIFFYDLFIFLGCGGGALEEVEEGDTQGSRSSS
ncbi:hypothetical protein QBC44DRAFT_327060 [Cladorrhinum sp. PSN332]|nr:hypothetical protein QBC44DRAFT_327060 [Cladorrhinum sp. PSN332]